MLCFEIYLRRQLLPFNYANLSEIYFLVWKNEKKFFKIFFPPALEKVLIYISRENFILEEEYDV